MKGEGSTNIVVFINYIIIEIVRLLRVMLFPKNDIGIDVQLKVSAQKRMILGKVLVALERIPFFFFLSVYFK